MPDMEGHVPWQLNEEEFLVILEAALEREEARHPPGTFEH